MGFAGATHLPLKVRTPCPDSRRGPGISAAIAINDRRFDSHRP